VHPRLPQAPPGGGNGAGFGQEQDAWVAPPGFAEPFHPVNMARRAMLDQVPCRDRN